MADIQRRNFISRMGLASVVTLAGCNGSGSSSPAPSLATDDEFPDEIHYFASGSYQYDEATRTLIIQISESQFPSGNSPQIGDDFSLTVRGIMSDAMFWLHRDDSRERLLQWVRLTGSSNDIVGQWRNAYGYAMTLGAGGAFELEYTGIEDLPQGFAGMASLASSPFQQAVASGDPGPRSLIIWTRVEASETSAVHWEVSTDPFFNEIAAAGTQIPLAGGTVKLTVSGLVSDTVYYYRFAQVSSSDGLKHFSLTGRGRTLPAKTAAVAKLKFAVVSCSSYPHGFFVAYRNVARRDDLDYVLHLGDYIYEYREDEYGNQEVLDQGRLYAEGNRKEIVTLEDYRARYQRYREDTDLQMLHARYAFITTWDDHETTDNSWDPDGRGPDGGAVNHNGGEGEWEQRKANGVQAYNEWMPIADIEDPFNPQIYRSFVFGSLMELMMLDTRIGGRSQQPDFVHDDFNDANRRLISPLQEAWLLQQLGAAQAQSRQWKLIGQQVMMAPFQGPPLLAEQPDSPPSGPVSPEWLNVLNTDGWDGYAASRQVIWDFVDSNKIDNLVVLTGDIHTSWAMELQQPLILNSAALNTNPGIEPLVSLQGPKYGVEFVTPSITSPGLEAVIPADIGITAAEEALKAYNPHIKYSNLSRRGYMILDVTTDACSATWYHVATIFDRENDREEKAAAYRVRTGSQSLEQA